ncbi:MAG: hypothetical protein V3S64_08950 [bacterium]
MALTLTIFTHPACPRCGIAVKAAWELKEMQPERFRLETIPLTEKAGLDQAFRENIKTIPTLLISDGDKELHRIVGAPGPGQLESAFDTVSEESHTP